MVPVGAVLDDRKLVGERRLGKDPGEADARHPVHVKRQNEAMPVDRRILIERVLDMDADVLPFAQPDERSRQHAVHGDRVTGAPSHGEGAVANRQADVLAGEGRHLRYKPWRAGLRPGRKQARAGQPGAPHCPCAQQRSPVDDLVHRS